jgi:hypothetical protein
MQNIRSAGTGQAYEIHCAAGRPLAKARESSGQAQRCRPRPPTVRLSLYCRHLAALPRTAASCQERTLALKTQPWAQAGSAQPSFRQPGR